MSTYLNKTSKILKTPLISCHNITVKYENVLALNDINLTIHQGDFVYIIGPNGAGKSTLIKLLTRLLKPTSGEITIDTNQIGYLPQINYTKSNFPITVNEVIYTGFKKQHLIMSKADKTLVNTWLQKMDIPNIGNQLMSTLSGGQQQRVLLIRAFISNPKLLILDEPTSALDPSFRSSFNDILKSLNQKGVTIIFITHDIKEIFEGAKIIYLDQRIAFIGDYPTYQSWEGDHQHV